MSPSNGDGIIDFARSATRWATTPAVRHATCRKPLTVLWLATAVSHAHSASKSRVNLDPGSAHGTLATTPPHCGRSTRGIAATDTIGNDEVVEPERNGLLFPVGDVDAGAAAVLRLLDDPLPREGIVGSFRERFTLDRMLETISAHYEEAAA